jgi:predicted transcriptional regulator
LKKLQNGKIMNRNKALDTVLEMPQEFEVEDLITKLLFIQSVEEGLEQSKAGNVVSFEEAKQRLSKWLQ